MIEPFQNQQSQTSDENAVPLSSTTEVHREVQKSTKKIRKESPQIKKNTGHWTPEEHQVYVQFLEDHLNIGNRKNNKIFKLMSETIGTRSPSQCRQFLIIIDFRSHHQKFNPYTAAGQKRIKRNRKRINTDLITLPEIVDVQQPMTPDVRSFLEVPVIEEYRYYEDSLPLEEDSYQINFNDNDSNSWEQK
ncbi:hypothetical protein pb186bvf_004742 [Paramecium bursaria]